MSAQAALQDTQENQFNDLKPLRILIVDDVPPLRSYVRQILENMGFTSISEASDGVEAMEKVVEFNVDLVFLDIQMTPMNGLEFLKQIRSGKTNIRRDLPVVVLTVAEDEAVLGTAMALDCDAFLNKPASQTEIGERIWRITSAKPSVRPSVAYKVIPIPDFSCYPPQARYSPSDLELMTEQVLSIPVGTVLDTDIRTVSGNMLLAAGTQLTQKYADRLADIAQAASLMLSNGDED